jgi:hypothetical protein
MKTLTLTKDEKAALRTPIETISPASNRGFTLKDIRLSDKICGKLEVEEDTVTLEDTEFSFLRDRFNGFDGWLPEKTIRTVLISVADKLEEVK